MASAVEPSSPLPSADVYCLWITHRTEKIYDLRLLGRGSPEDVGIIKVSVDFVDCQRQVEALMREKNVFIEKMRTEGKLAEGDPTEWALKALLFQEILLQNLSAHPKLQEIRHSTLATPAIPVTNLLLEANLGNSGHHLTITTEIIAYLKELFPRLKHIRLFSPGTDISELNGKAAGTPIAPEEDRLAKLITDCSSRPDLADVTIEYKEYCGSPSWINDIPHPHSRDVPSPFGRCAVRSVSGGSLGAESGRTSCGKGEGSDGSSSPMPFLTKQALQAMANQGLGGDTVAPSPVPGGVGILNKDSAKLVGEGKKPEKDTGDEEDISAFRCDFP